MADTNSKRPSMIRRSSTSRDVTGSTRGPLSRDTSWKAHNFKKDVVVDMNDRRIASPNVKVSDHRRQSTKMIQKSKTMDSKTDIEQK